MSDAFRLEHAADFDRLFGRVAGIGVDQLVDAIAEGTRDERDDLLGAARPFVPVAATFGADPPLEGIEAFLVAELEKTVGFGFGA